MDRYSRAGLADASVLTSLKSNDATNRSALADLLADLGEVDERELWRNVASSSLHEYCTEELNWTDDEAYKRVRVAQVARRFPAIFHAIADGRLNSSGVLLLKTQLSEENVDELISVAARKTRRQIERLLADRAPKPDLLARIEPIDSALPAPTPSLNLAPGPISITRTKLEPLGAQRTGLHTMIDDETSALLQRAQDLLGHRDVPTVLKRALKLLVAQLEKRKFAVTDRPRRSKTTSDDSRYIPAHVRRAVYLRDGGQCTYVCPETGKRCASCRRLEYDHVIPRARGGKSTRENLRLRCRAHNQLAAEQEFGRAFMKKKRGGSDDPIHRDLVLGLRHLGYRAAEAKDAATFGMKLADASLEQRMRAALGFLRPQRAAPELSRFEQAALT